MNFKKISTLLLALTFIWACSKDDAPKTPENAVPEISAKTFSVVETISDDYIIGTVTATDTDKDDLKFSITANSNDLFEITDGGAISLFTGKTLDAATPMHEITVSVADNKDTASAKITINVVDVTLTLNQEAIELPIGGNEQIVATLNGTTGTIAWSSDNEDVATVDDQGNITAVSSGEALITASFGSITATLTITVTPDVYIVGRAYKNGDNNESAIVWKNGEPTFLTDGTKNADARDVFVHNNDVYVVGFERNENNIWVAKLWINGEPTDLSDGVHDSFATSIFIENDNIYISGYTRGENAIYIALVWTNGEITNLSDGNTNNFAYSLYVENGIVYVAGREFSNKYIAKQWVDGNPTLLTDGTNTASTYSIFVDQSTVYVVGYERETIAQNQSIQHATLWINGSPTILSDVYSNALDVFVANGIPFVSYSETIDHVTYLRIWENGEITTIVEDFFDDNGGSLFVKNGNLYVAYVESLANDAGYMPHLYLNGETSDLNVEVIDNVFQSVYIQSIFVN